MALNKLQVDQWCGDFSTSDRKLARLADGGNLFLEGRRNSQGRVSFSWVMRWRDGADKNAQGVGKDRSKGLGVYLPKAPKSADGDYVTLKQAREAAEAIRAGFDRDGRDPGLKVRMARDKLQADALEAKHIRKAAEDADARRTKYTVEAAIREWHAATCGELTSPKYSAQRLRRLLDYVPLIGSIAVERLTRSDVVGAHDVLIKAKDGNAAGVTKRPETLKRTSGDLAKAIDWAINRGWAGDNAINPVPSTRTTLEKPAKRVGRRTIDPANVAEFWQAVAEAGKGQRYPVAVRLLAMLTLTAARTKEIRLMQWSDVVDLDGDMPMIRVPAERMKRREEWSCMLSPDAVAILREVKSWQSEAGQGLKGVKDGFVFVRLEGTYKGRVCSENAVNDLLADIGWHDQMTGHGLRKLFSTVAHDKWPYVGSNRTEAVEFSIAHAPEDKIRATYDLNDFRHLRAQLMTWWSEYLRVKTEAKAGTVVHLKRA